MLTNEQELRPVTRFYSKSLMSALADIYPTSQDGSDSIM